MKKPKSFSIVIPAYNEEKTIEEIVQAVLSSDTLGLKKEIIVVDDGSIDNTPKILKKLDKKHNNIKVVLKKKNEGKCSALKTGFSKAAGDIVIVQDADLEYNPRDYVKLLRPFIENDADVVYGSRLSTSEPHRVMYFWHYKVNQFLTLLSNIFTNLNLTDMETGYKVFRGDIIRKIAPKLNSTRFGFEPEITARIAKLPEIKIYEVGISYAGRTYAEGKHINWKDGVKALWEIIYYNLLTK